MTTDESYIEAAIEEGKRAMTAGNWPFGAVIVRNSEIVARGMCTETSSNNALGHAELNAINAACTILGRGDLSDCAIYGTNEPCLMCASAIFQAKIPSACFSLSRSDLPKLFRERKLHIDDLVPDAGYEVRMTKGILKEKVFELFEGVRK